MERLETSMSTRKIVQWDPGSPSACLVSDGDMQRTLGNLPVKAKRTGIVYLIRFKNGKGYVGQTMQKLSQRMKDHLKSSSGCRALKAALRKYGSDAWEVQILAIVSEDELNAEECRLIAELGTLVPDGYNILLGGGQLRDPASQEAMRQARIASEAFQAARKEVQARASTVLRRRKTTAAKREARIADMDVVAADRTHYDAWRHAYRHARLAAQKLPEGSLRDPFAEVAALYGAGPPTRNPDAVASLKAKESVRISEMSRDCAKRRREERVASMQPEEAAAFMKQARWRALSVAKKHRPDKLAEVEARWAEEWEEFETRLRTQGPLASFLDKKARKHEKARGKQSTLAKWLKPDTGSSSGSKLTRSRPSTSKDATQNQYESSDEESYKESDESSDEERG